MFLNEWELGVDSSQKKPQVPYSSTQIFNKNTKQEQE